LGISLVTSSCPEFARKKKDLKIKKKKIANPGHGLLLIETRTTSQNQEASIKENFKTKKSNKVVFCWLKSDLFIQLSVNHRVRLSQPRKKGFEQDK